MHAGSTCSSTNRKTKKANPNTCFSNGMLILSIHSAASLNLCTTFAQLRFRDAAISLALLCNALFHYHGQCKYAASTQPEGLVAHLDRLVGALCQHDDGF
jgi:hypothetical protein